MNSPWWKVHHATGNPGIAEQNFAALVREFDQVAILGEIPYLPQSAFDKATLLTLAEKIDLDSLICPTFAVDTSEPARTAGENERETCRNILRNFFQLFLEQLRNLS